MRRRQSEPYEMLIKPYSTQPKVKTDRLDALAGGDHATQQSIERRGGGGSRPGSAATRPQLAGSPQAAALAPNRRPRAPPACNRGEW